jgi:hypothetical protein
MGQSRRLGRAPATSDLPRSADVSKSVGTSQSVIFGLMHSSGPPRQNGLENAADGGLEPFRWQLSSSRQCIEQDLGAYEVGCFESLGGGVECRNEEAWRLISFVPIAQNPGHAHRTSQRKGPCMRAGPSLSLVRHRDFTRHVLAPCIDAQYHDDDRAQQRATRQR